MRWFFGLAGVVAVGALGACATITGLDQYKKGEPQDASVADLDVNSMNPPGPDGQTTGSSEGGDDAEAEGGTITTCLDTQNDVLNCGACGTACDHTRSRGAACVQGVCTYTGCGPGWLDCDKSGSNANGCETSDTEADNCGKCGNVCDKMNSVGATCVALDGGVVTCQYSGCNPGWGDCKPAAPDIDGCETSLATPQNCGMCKVACDTATSTGAACADGTTCTYTGCQTGYADCKTNAPDTDGCETQVAPGSCTACGGQSCDSSHSVSPVCEVDAGAATCTYSGCDQGYADCNKSPPDQNGCETKLDSISNCGACGRACDTKQSTGATCTSGNCTYSGCQAGYLDCDTSNHNTNGCESSATSTTTCGGCNVACNTNTGTASCDGATCSYQCNSGLFDCNAGTAPDTDGCECATPSCCGTNCQTTHNNGVGQNFYDCAATGQNNQTEATAACNAYLATQSGNTSTCSQSSTCCGINIVVGCLGSTATSICGTANGKCYCWQYGNGSPNPGRVQAESSSCRASCGSSSDPQWN